MKNASLLYIEFLAGIRNELPILLGVIPFGMVYGVAALAAGLPPGVAQAMSAVVFAGSAQLLAVKLIGSGAPAPVVILTVFIVNLRHALYSASMAPYIERLSPVWKGLLAYLLTDEAYAVTIIHYVKPASNPLTIDYERERHWFFLGAGLALWTSWQISTAVGIFLSTQVPSSWSLDFTLALTFIALVVPNIRDRASVVAALTAGFTALLAYHLPDKLGLVAAALVGIIAGMWSEARWG